MLSKLIFFLKIEVCIVDNCWSVNGKSFHSVHLYIVLLMTNILKFPYFKIGPNKQFFTHDIYTFVVVCFS